MAGMTLIHRIAARLLVSVLVIVSVLLLPSMALAQAGDGAADGFGIEGIETGLIALFPLVMLVSSVLLKPEAQDDVKKLLPFGVGLIVSVLYFISNGWPGFGAEVVANVMAMITFSKTLYDPANSLSKLVTAGKSLNAITTRGVIGSAPELIEGD